MLGAFHRAQSVQPCLSVLGSSESPLWTVSFPGARSPWRALVSCATFNNLLMEWENLHTKERKFSLGFLG